MHSWETADHLWEETDIWVIILGRSTWRYSTLAAGVIDPGRKISITFNFLLSSYLAPPLLSTAQACCVTAIQREVRVRSHAPSILSHRGTKVVWPDFQPMRVPEEPVCIQFCWQNLDFTSLHFKSPIHVVPPLISSQWESRKNRFAFVSFGKIQFLPPCIWDLPFMSYHLRRTELEFLKSLWGLGTEQE